MKERTIGQINKKIENNEAKIYTAEEFKKLIKEDNAPSFEEVDVVTAGTCGVMSGTAAIFNFTVSEPGVFMRAKNMVEDSYSNTFLKEKILMLKLKQSMGTLLNQQQILAKLQEHK